MPTARPKIREPTSPVNTERIFATYAIETLLRVAKAAAVLAGEQSSGTFVAVPGETEELNQRCRWPRALEFKIQLSLGFSASMPCGFRKHSQLNLPTLMDATAARRSNSALAGSKDDARINLAGEVKNFIQFLWTQVFHFLPAAAIFELRRAKCSFPA